MLTYCAAVRSVAGMTTSEITGYRVVETLPVIGETLGRSYVWDGDQITDEALPGTCAFSTLAAAREYGRWSRGFWIIGLAGERACWGDLAYEVIIRDAVVVEIIEQIS